MARSSHLENPDMGSSSSFSGTSKVLGKYIKSADPEAIINAVNRGYDLKNERMTQVQQDAATRRTELQVAETQARRESDFAALSEGRPDEVQDWRDIAELTVQLSLQRDQDEEADELVNAMLWTYGDQIKDYTQAIGGEEWWDDNYVPMPEQGGSWYDPALRGAGRFFGYLDQWGQSAKSSLAGLESAVSDDGVSAGDALRHSVRQGAAALDISRAIPGYDGLSQHLEGTSRPDLLIAGEGEGEDSYRVKVLDQDGDGSLNLRESVGREHDSGGRTAGVFDFLGSVLVDPSTYASLGGSSMARVGMRAAEEAAEDLAREGVEGMSRELAEELNQRIARRGWKSLDVEDQQLYSNLLRHANERAAEAGGRTTTRTGRFLIGERQALNEAQLDAIRRGGQSGVRLAGTTAVPTGRLGDLGRATGLLGDVVYGRRVVDAADDELLTQVVRESVQQGLAGRLRDIPMIDTALSNLNLFGAVKARFGEGVANTLRENMSITRSQEGEVKDIMVRLGADMHRNGLLRQAIEEVGDEETLHRAINEWMSGTGNLDEIVSVGGEKTQLLLDTLQDVRTEVYQSTLRGMGYTREEVQAIIRGELDPPANLRDINTYVPRILSDAVRHDTELLREIANLSEDAAQDVAGTSMREGFLRRRGIARSVDDLFEANDEAQRIMEHLGIETPGDLFETNVPRAFVARSQSAFRAAADVDLLEGLTELTGPGGIPLGFRATAEEGGLTAAARAEQLIKDAGGRLADYRTVTLPNGTVFRVHEELAKPLEDARRIFGDPREISAFGQFFDKMNNMWAAFATVGGVNPGFHARNSVGNWFLGFLGGTRDASVYARAGRLQDTHRDIIKATRETGQSFAEAAKGLDISPEDLRILTEARRLGVLSDGRSLDILRETAGESPVADTGNRLNPMSESSVFTKPGRVVGSVVEDNARLGVFIDQLNKGASPRAAAAHVKEYLFDYGELTRFESEVLRRGARFYTFMRKNTALQAAMLVQYPGRVANAEEAVDTLVGLLGDPADPDGGTTLPPWMLGADVRNVGGDNVALDYDTPFASFRETGGLVGSLIPDNSPEARFREREGFLSRLDGLFSGVGPGVLDFLEEQRTGRDSFTGRPLTPPGTMRDGEDVGLVRDHWLFRAADTFAPVVSRIERQGRQTGAWGDPEDEQDPAVALANIFLGVQAYELGEDSDNASRYVVEKTLEDALDELRDAGIPAPTLAEARENGQIALRDRVMEALLYSWEEDPETGELRWSDSIRDDRLLNIVPKDVRQALQLPEPSSGVGSSKGTRPDAAEGSDLAIAIEDFDDAQILSAISTYLGRELSDEEKAAVLVALPTAPGNTALEYAGIEPERDGNRFLRQERDVEAERSAALESFERRAENAGLSTDYIREMRPRLSNMERIINEAQAAGLSDDELWTYVTRAEDEGGGGVLSRNDKAFLNQLYGNDRTDGPFDLTTTRLPEFNEEDAEKLRVKAWQAEQELRIAAELAGLPQPTAEQVRDYILNSTLTGGELDALDEANLDNAPNRKDVRTDEQFARDTLAKRDAAESGIGLRFGG